MAEIVALAIALLALVILASLLARRASMPEPLLLVAIGLAVSWVPGVPEVKLHPNLVLHVFLPLLVYATALEVPWKQFRANLRPIGFLGIGLVVFTTAGVAIVAHAIVPGISWPAAFALGAIVSPPDEVTAAAVIDRLPIPRRIAVILQGEGLINDVSALTIFRYAVLAAATGAFSFAHAGEFFVSVLVGGAVWGVMVGWGALWIRGHLDDPRLETTVSLITPFAAYFVPEYFGATGVLSTAVAGLVVNSQSARMISAETRLNATPLWGMIDYWLNGVLFLLLGLQIKAVTEAVPAGHLGEYLVVSAAVAATAIALRFLWVYVTAYTPGLWHTATGAARAPRGNRLFFISWTGMRGAISLAAALALPHVLPDGKAFPARDLIIFVTFAVIVFTLIVQGGSLPLLIRMLGLEREGNQERDKATRSEYDARIRTLGAGVAHMDALVAAGEIPRDVGERYKREREHRQKTFERHRKAHGDRDRRRQAKHELDALMEAAQAERDELLRLRSAGEIDDDTLHRIERDLDEQELRLQARQDTLR